MTAPAASRARPGRRRGGRAWPLARLAAADVLPLSPVRRTLGEALGCVLAEDVTARNDLPAADNSAMDGWAVAGRPPWRIVADRPAGTLPGARLRAGEGVRIATGASLPPGAEAVVPVEDSTRDASGVRPVTPAPRDGNPRSHIRYAVEPSWATIARPATLSQEYSLTRPLSTSPPQAVTRWLRSISSASPPAVGNTRTGVP